MSAAREELNDRDWELPNLTLEEYRPRSSKYCVTIPVLNEGNRITRQLDRMRPLCADLDILICDGGSTDGCTVPERMKPRGVRTVIRKTAPGRMSSQLRLLFAYALRQGYAGVVNLDGNDKDGVEAIPRFVALLDEGYDCVLGSRFLPGEKISWTRFGGVTLIVLGVLTVSRS